MNNQTHEFTPKMAAALTDLFMATGGQVGRFHAVKDDDLTAYEALLRYRLIVLENHEAGLVTRWTAALTDDGRRFFLEYNQLDEADVASLPIRETITLNFNLRNETEARIYDWLQTVRKSGTLLTTLHHAITLHAVLESGHIEALLEAYPQLADYLQQNIEAQIDARDTRQMNQVLSEIEAMKALLKNQQRGHAAPPETPAPKPIGLRPVVPLTPPETAPRQLSVPQFEVPKYDEDEDDSQDLFVVQQDFEAGKRANQNFLKSVLSLQDDDNEGER